MTVYETTNHHTIYHWATSRGLFPAIVVGEPDRIRLGGDDSANPGEDLEPVEWWRWFQAFDARQRRGAMRCPVERRVAAGVRLRRSLAIAPGEPHDPRPGRGRPRQRS